jgi:Uncharacterized conserved protein (COG2071)
VIEPASFTPSMLERHPPRGLDVTTTLRDFAIVTYAVTPSCVSRHVASRYTPEVIDTPRGPRALVSVVPFRDTAFRFAGCPSPGLGFGQTNYRTYVRDVVSGARVAWFFGTALDSPAVAVPRHIWQLPWHRARIRLDCRYDAAAGRYTTYSMRAEGRWGAATLDVVDSGEPPSALDGFPDLETALVVLTHPLCGVYHRRDGLLGTYSVWHAPLRPTVGECRSARFAVLDELELVAFADQASPHSVLLQATTDFTIYLPPRQVTAVAVDKRSRDGGGSAE